jgi:hypothetical protein
MFVNALYIYQAPVRLDYANMKVRQLISSGSGNEVVFAGRSSSYFVFREFKTSSTYGEVRIDIAPELYDIIKDAEGTLLPYASAAVLGNIVRGEFGFGVDILRHSFIMDQFPKLKTIKQKEALARRMLHSVAMQERYNLVGAED